MNNNILRHTALRFLAAAAIIMAFSATAFSQQTEQGYALIVDQSPARAGRVTPNVGVHRPQINETVTIQAIPRPGYRFVYWMGDVLNPTANRTSVKLNAPKLVIAIFEREDFELLSRSNAATGGSSAGGAIRKPQEKIKALEYYRGDDEIRYIYPDYDDGYYIPVPGDGNGTPDTDDGNDILVPGNDNDILVPGNNNDILVPGNGNEILVPGEELNVPVEAVPEPATMLMLSAGAMFLRRRDHKQRQK